MRKEEQPVNDVRVGNSFLTLLGVSVFIALISAMTFVIMLPLSTKPPDQAAGNSWLLSDPLVSTSVLLASFAIGGAITPLSYLFLRDRKLALSAPIVLGAVIISILVLTPISGWLGFWGSMFVGLVAMAVISRSSHPSLKVT